MDPCLRKEKLAKNGEIGSHFGAFLIIQRAPTCNTHRVYKIARGLIQTCGSILIYAVAWTKKGEGWSLIICLAGDQLL